MGVTPDGGTAPSVPHRTGGSYGFTVTNTGGLAATASFSSVCSGGISGCTAVPALAPLGVGASTAVSGPYNGTTVGSGTATLTATYNEYPSTTDNGSVNVTVTANPVYGVSVVPVNPSQSVTVGTALIPFECDEHQSGRVGAINVCAGDDRSRHGRLLLAFAGLGDAIANRSRCESDRDLLDNRVGYHRIGAARRVHILTGVVQREWND